VASYGTPYVNMLSGRASGDAIFIEPKRIDVKIFVRPRSALAVAMCFTGICTVFISKKSIMCPRDIGLIPSRDGTHVNRLLYFEAFPFLNRRVTV
jgi:hypothetical protein